MKTNPTARRLVKVRLILACAAIVSVAVVEFGVGHSLASRVGHTTTRQTVGSQSPDVTLDDLMLAAR